MFDNALVQGTPEWLELRKTKVTASDIPIIMGVSPYKNVKQLYNEKLGGENASLPTIAMQYGTAMEPEARYILSTIIEEDFYPAVKFPAEHSWLMASLDGYHPNGDDSSIIEIKCPYSRKIPEAIPGHHFAQMQAQMFCAGVKKGIYFVYVPRTETEPMSYLLQHVDFDPDYWATCLERAEVFHRCLVKQDFSEFENLDWDVIIDGEVQQIVEEYKTACKKVALWEELKANYKAEILKRCSRNTKAFGMKIEKKTRLGSIDYSSISELEGIDLEPYRKPNISYWQISEDKI